MAGDLVADHDCQKGEHSAPVEGASLCWKHTTNGGVANDGAVKGGGVKDGA